MFSKNVEVFIGCDKNYDEARHILFGASFDSTTSYRPGARFASKAIRSESYAIETYSPYQDRDLEDTSVCDVGDLELCIGETETSLNQIEAFVSGMLNTEAKNEKRETGIQNSMVKVSDRAIGSPSKKIPIMIGGEHLVTLPVIRALYTVYPDLHIIHFDAHADLRDDYLGAKLSHATVMRRVWEILGDGRIHQFGIRSGDKSEFTWGKERVFTQKFNFLGMQSTIEKLRGKPVYFSLDLDVLDPSIFPGTGTPEAGGVSFVELLEAVLLLGELDIVGLDMVELSPVYDQSGVSTAVACKLLRELLLVVG